MSYQVLLSREAEKVLDRVDSTMGKRLRARVKQLGEDPFNPRLSAPLVERAGMRKSRVGGWRILFTADREVMVVGVVAIRPRGDAYRHSL